MGFGVGAVVLIPALGMGMTFPLLTDLVAPRDSARGAAVGRAYALNTLGSIVGAVLTGFVLVVTLGTDLTLRLGVAINAAAALALAVVAAQGVTEGSETHRRLRLRVLGAGALASVGLAFALAAPRWSTRLIDLGPSIYARQPMSAVAVQQFLEHRGVRQLAYREGWNATVSVWESGPGRTLKVNGKADASDHGDMDTEILLGLAPVAARPGAATALVIGYGSGVTTRTLAGVPGMRGVRVVEIEPAVLEMSRFFQHVNDTVLARPNVSVVVDDARSALQIDPARYDVIVSEPSNPWLAGVATLYTPEFFRIVRDRLTDGGVFSQWVQLYQLREDAAVGEAVADDPEELWRVEGGDAREPGIGRLGDDHVVARRVDLERAARVVHHHGDVGPGKDGVVHVLEEAAHLQHGGLDLDHAHAPHSGDAGERARGYTAAIADHQRRGGARARCDRGEAEQDLRVHVAVVGGVGLPVDLERATGPALPHRHSSVPALLVSQLPHAAVLEELLHRCGAHRLAGVDAGAKGDEPGAPAGRGERYDEPHARQGPGAEHPQPQPSVGLGAFGDAPRGQHRQRQRRGGVDRYPQAQREVGAECDHQHESREHRTNDAAERIERVGAAHGGAARAVPGRYEVREEGERHAHTERRDQHHGADAEAHREQPLDRAERLRLEDADDVARQQAEHNKQRSGTGRSAVCCVRPVAALHHQRLPDAVARRGRAAARDGLRRRRRGADPGARYGHDVPPPHGPRSAPGQRARRRRGPRLRAQYARQHRWCGAHGIRAGGRTRHRPHAAPGGGDQRRRGPGAGCAGRAEIG